MLKEYIESSLIKIIFKEKIKDRIKMKEKEVYITYSHSWAAFTGTRVQNIINSSARRQQWDESTNGAKTGQQLTRRQH